jgi:hypothetical protein
VSSKPNAAPKGKGQPAAGKKDKESKAVKGPIITPQILGVLFGIIAIVVLALMMDNTKKQRDAIAAVQGQIAQKDTEIKTYKAKAAKKDEADKLNKALKAKLSSLDYLFMEDQTSLMPFYEGTFFPILDGSNLVPGEDAKITVSQYVFRINMAMRPFETLPGSAFFDDSAKAFQIEYVPENNGVPNEEPLDTRPTHFLEPYDIKLEGFVGTFNDVKRFVKALQEQSPDKLFSVHCLKNDDGKVIGGIRTRTPWTVSMTVYFINPEQAATGDAPPSPPGSKSC